MRVKKIMAVVLAAVMLAGPVEGMHIPGNPVTVEAAKKTTKK